MKKVWFLILYCLVMLSLSAQSNRVSNRKAKKWFNKMEWANGCQLTPHPSINKKEFAYQYQKNKALWDTAFRFLATHDLSTLERGEYPLAGNNAVVKVSFGPAKKEEETKWETHKKFIDVQVVGAGTEKIGVAKLSEASDATTYNEGNDVTNHNAKGTFYTAVPGMFFLFFPQDAHRPGIKVTDGDVRKIVIKIQVAD